jgi:hypothetical protein
MLPRPHDAHGLAVQCARPWAGHAAAPRAPTHLPVEGEDLAVPGEQQRERVVGDLAHPDVGDVDHHHAQLGRGRDVDDVVADAGARDDLESLERAHHGTGDRRRRGDEPVGVAGLGDQLVLGADEGQRGHRGRDARERGLAVGVVALAATLDDVDALGLVGHDGSVLTGSRDRSRAVYRRPP